MLSLSLRTVCLPLSATATIFPAAEELLEKTEFQKSVEHFASRKNMGRYNSTMDFLFGELMQGKWKAAIFRFYNDEGPKLIDDPRTTTRMVSDWDKQIVTALKTAWWYMDQTRTQSWSSFHVCWRDVLASPVLNAAVNRCAVQLAT